VGIAFFSAWGAEILKQVYHDSRQKYKDRRFQEAGSFEKASFTDLLQEVIDRGFTVHALEISQGWVEIQSPVDYAHALEMVE
jgi:phosphoenolpyruvate phosphomutase